MVESVISSWKVNSRVTSYLIEHLEEEHLALKIPGSPRRTIRMIGGHIHNCRCMWIKMLGRSHSINPPESVDRFRVSRDDLLSALDISGEAVAALLQFGFDHGGRLAGFPPDVVHFSAYLIAHEGHHRGQIIMVARQQGHRLPESVTTGIWQWSKRLREVA